MVAVSPIFVNGTRALSQLCDCSSALSLSNDDMESCANYEEPIGVTAVTDKRALPRR